MKKGAIIAQGKTKRIHAADGNHKQVVIESFDDITKNNDPSKTQQMKGKAIHATTTTCAVFELLKEAGLPVAFERQLSRTEFLAPKCRMMPLEVIARRHAVGSYLKRHPELAVAEGQPPRRFDSIVTELFLKTTGGKIVDFNGQVIDTITANAEGKVIDDPFISPDKDGHWLLLDPDLPGHQFKAVLSKVESSQFLPSSGVTIEKILELTRKTFLVLEEAWSRLGCRLIDFKIEFGVDADGNLYIADVIDNDSWRLRDQDWKELSKQLFRDNADMETIANKYELVAKLVLDPRFKKAA